MKTATDKENEKEAAEKDEQAVAIGLPEEGKAKRV